MSDKEAVLEAVRELPETFSLAEISEEIALLAAIRRGEEAADAGRVTPHEKVPELLAAWLKTPRQSTR